MGKDRGNGRPDDAGDAMLRGVRAVIFDLDGTLIDSMGIWKDIDREYLGKFGISLPDGLQRDIEGMSFSETAHYFRRHFSIEDSVEDIKEEWNQMAWEKYAREIPFKEGAKELVRHLREEGVRTGIATSNSVELVGAVLRRHGMEGAFDSVHTACEVERGKPAPDIYELVARELGVPPSACLVFEDLVAGILAGKRAGMRVCAVSDEFSRESAEEKRRISDYYIESFLDLRCLGA